MYDLVIIGIGPAGLTASIYASCFRLKHLLIGRELGGQMMLAPDILNYPGFTEITGKELTQKMVEQVKERGGEIAIASVVKIMHIYNKSSNVNNATTSANNESCFEIEVQDGKKYQAKAIILATGTERKKLNVTGETQYTGKGIHYCASCEKSEYGGKICAVAGGANAALQAAVQISQSAAKVFIIYRGDNLRGDPVWLERIGKDQKIEVLYNTIITEILGDGEKLTGVAINGKCLPAQAGKMENGKLKQTDTPQISLLPLDKLFIEIGGVPGSALVVPLGVEMDGEGYIKVNNKLETNIAGLFAAGDLVSSSLSIEQISSAIGLGARAAVSAFAYLRQDKIPSLWGISNIKR